MNSPTTELELPGSSKKTDQPKVAVILQKDLKAACNVVLNMEDMFKSLGGLRSLSLKKTGKGDKVFQFQAALSSREGFLLGKGWAYRLLLVLSRLWKYG